MSPEQNEPMLKHVSEFKAALESNHDDPQESFENKEQVAAEQEVAIAQPRVGKHVIEMMARFQTAGYLASLSRRGRFQGGDRRN